jgi:hypothetical protein
MICFSAFLSSRRAVLGSALLSILIGLGGPAAWADPDPARFECKAAPANTKVSVTFQAGGASMRDLAAWVMSFSCKNVVFSEDVAMNTIKVNVLSPNELSPKQAMELFVDAVEATGLVVKQKANTIVISLGPKMPRGCPGTSASPTTMKPDRTSDPLATGAPGGKGAPSGETETESEFDKLVDRGVRLVDATHATAKADVILALKSNPMAVSKGFRAVPYTQDGKTIGVKVFAVRPTSFVGRIGLRNGDLLKAINGYELTSIDKVLEVYGKLAEATAFELELERRGKPLHLTITVVP